MSDSVRPHRQRPTRLPRPWDSPGKNAGVGCHFLLQGMKVKSECEVAQSCPTLRDPMDCSPPGSSAHRIFQARILEWVPLPSPFISWETTINKSCSHGDLIAHSHVYTRDGKVEQSSKVLMKSAKQRGDHTVSSPGI